MSKKPSKSLAQELDRYITPFRYDGSGKFHLKAHKTDEKGDLDKEKALAILDANKKRLIGFQEKLYAQDRWSLLIVFQAMDAGGKDSAIKAIFEGINPQGCEVHAFKAPSSKELDHDFLWRHAIALPERGHIGIFNRSHYEECLVTRVHPEILAKEKLPQKLVTKNIWKERFEDISAFERYLCRNGTVVLKFFLNVSKDEQRERFRSIGWRIRPSSGSSPWTTSRSARCGRATRRSIRTSSGTPRRLMRRGTSCPRTTNGSRAS
ncbi:PPK2 family polyphosphate:nucleotide phosphotransferase [Bradyrhizobium ottawaense]